jgi:hypothetical protein
MIKLILVTALLSLSGLAGAACQRTEYTDLRNTHAEIFKRIPIKQQGNYGLCYSYAGTTLVDYYRMKLGKPQYSNISPLEAGVLATIFANNDSEEGGNICNVVKALAVKGSACTDSIVGSEVRYKDLGAVFHQNMVEQVFMPFLIKTEEFKEVSAAKFASRAGLNKTQANYLARFDAFYKVLKPKIASHKFTKETIPTASEVFLMAQRIHVKNTYNLLGPSFIQLLLEKSCTVRSISIPKLDCDTLSGSPDTLMGDIDKQISEKSPVGISYCSVMLSEKGTNGLDGSGKMKSNCGAHGSVIIGRKGDSNGACHYLIRNSWGDSFKYAWPTSNGDVWVSEYQLKRNVFWVHVVND